MSSGESYNMYLTARVAAKRTTLFPQAQYEEMLGYGSISAMIKYLDNSPYQADLAEALSHADGADAIEEAVSRHMERVFSEALAIGYGEPSGMNLIGMFLMRWDLMAVKALLRHVFLSARFKYPLPAIMPGPSLQTGLMASLAGQPTVDALIQALVQWNPFLCGALQPAWDAHPVSDPDAQAWVGLEDVLDRTYFTHSLVRLSTDENGQLLRDFLRMEIDRINLRAICNVFAYERNNRIPVDSMLPGGHLPKTLLAQMLDAGSLESATLQLEKTRYQSLHRGLYAMLQRNSFAVLERKFEALFIYNFLRMARFNPYSMAPLMHYVWMRSIEAANLQVLARGITAKLPAGRIQEELVYV